MNAGRRFVSLLTAMSFLVLAVTGLLAFFRPFSIKVIGLHSLIGFVFLGLVVLHVANNRGHLNRYLRSKTVWATGVIVVGLTVLFLWQPKPIKAILGLSKNLGPAMERFEMSDEGMVCFYQPAEHYRMELRVKGGKGFDPENLPPVAIWLENASFYHIKTLHEPREEDRTVLPYWSFKYRGWQEAEKNQKEVDAVSEPTLNSSFDPADYVLPADPDKPMPYRLLIEIDQPDDGKPSLVFSVEIDNADPRTFQLLELQGYPKREDDEEGEEQWSLYFVDEIFDSVLELVDSALLTIERD